jgi:hypothetical protein
MFRNVGNIAKGQGSQLHLGVSVKFCILRYQSPKHILYMRLFAWISRLLQVTHHSRLFSIYFEINADNWIELRTF